MSAAGARFRGYSYIFMDSFGTLGRMNIKQVMVIAGCLVTGVGWAQQAPVERPGGHIDLPSSKQIVGVVPGSP